MPAGILAGLLLGAVHLAMFHRGISLVCSAAVTGAGRGLAMFLGAMRLVFTAGVGCALVQSGVSPTGLGIGLLVALYVYRLGLMMIRLPERGRV